MPYNNKNGKPSNKNKFNNNQKKKFNNKKEKKSNENFTLKLFDKGISGTRTYNYDSFVQLLDKLNEDGIFSTISIPVYMYRNDVTNKPSMKGTIQAGFIRSIEGGTVEVSIFASYTDYVHDFDNPIVYPRVIVREDEVATIIGFDVCDASRYSYDEDDEDETDDDYEDGDDEEPLEQED